MSTTDSVWTRDGLQETPEAAGGPARRRLAAYWSVGIGLALG